MVGMGIRDVVITTDRELGDVISEWPRAKEDDVLGVKSKDAGSYADRDDPARVPPINELWQRALTEFHSNSAGRFGRLVDNKVKPGTLRKKS